MPPSDSPELSPINGTPKQEAAFEDSILKDRLYSQSETLAPPQYVRRVFFPVSTGFYDLLVIGEE